MFALIHKSTFCSTHAFYSHYSVSSTQKLSVSCLHSATHTHSVLTCIQLSLCSLCCQIQSTPSILSATNSAVWYLHTVSFNHYNLLHTHILFYSCVLFHLYSLVSHKQLPSCLHSSIKEHSVLPMRSIPSIQSFPHKNSHFLVYTQLHTRILFCPCVQLSLCSLCCQIQSTPSILSATNCTVWYLHTVSFNHYNLLYTTILFYSCVLFHLHSLVSHKQLPSCLHSSIKEHSVIPCVPFPLFSLFHTKTVSFLFTHSYTHAFCSTHALNFVLHSILSNTVDSIYIVSYKQCSLILTYSQFQSLQLAIHNHSVLLMRSIPSTQSCFS